MKTVLISVLAFLMFFQGCRSEVAYSRALFNHIPDKPELLVLVRPNDIASLAEAAFEELKLNEFLDGKLDIDAKQVDHYLNITTQMLEALGIPWRDVESVGFLLYFQKPVVLVSGGFLKEDVETKLNDLGFKQNANGQFDYVYHEQKLFLPTDGLMMMAEAALLEDLSMVPEDRRLWNRDDFEEYRLTSPLNNSLFIWTHPPEDFLSDFEYREDLGDVSLALNFRHNITLKTTIRVKDPKKAVYLSDIMIGIFKISSGLFGDDPDYGPVFKGIQVSHDNRQVEASLVIPQNHVQSLKNRIINDFQNNDTSTFNKLETFMNRFK